MVLRRRTEAVEITVVAPRHRGMTLIETLVVLGLVFFLMALLLPAVESAREAARRGRCSANLRLIGLALNQYHEFQGCFPPGRIQSYDPRYAGPSPPCTSMFVDKGLLIDVLPMMEQQAVYDAINQDLTILGAENSTIHTVVVAAYACPDDFSAGVARELAPGELARYGLADPPGARRRMAFSTYAGLTGSFQVTAFPLAIHRCRVPAEARAANNGAFHDVSPISASSFTDGLANTIVVSEKSTVTLKVLDQLHPAHFQKHGWYITGNWADTLVTTFYPPNAFKTTGLGAINARLNSASSLHPGGVNVLLGDGSVHFVKESIDSWPFSPANGQPVGARRTIGDWWENLPRAGVWQALSTRGGGEVVSSDVW